MEKLWSTVEDTGVWQAWTEIAVGPPHDIRQISPHLWASNSFSLKLGISRAPWGFNKPLCVLSQVLLRLQKLQRQWCPPWQWAGSTTMVTTWMRILPLGSQGYHSWPALVPETLRFPVLSTSWWWPLRDAKWLPFHNWISEMWRPFFRFPERAQDEPDDHMGTLRWCQLF